MMLWKYEPGRRARPLVIGHRGAPLRHTENTIISYKTALELGADAIEVDVQLTADGHIVCCHDPDLERITGTRITIAENTLADCRSAFPDLATLEQVCAAFPKAGILIDTKIDTDDFADELRRVCASTQAFGRIMVGAPSPTQAQRLRRRLDLPFCALFKAPVELSLYSELSLSWMRLHPKEYRLETVQTLHAAGIGAILLANADMARGGGTYPQLGRDRIGRGNWMRRLPCR
ncbi:glycerophosphodiester phosphodiesterase [Rhizobium laguerreae]|uniref:glycerophosphodiester phosphodiesterase n=1 Tax=Rhizobium laguerreae TaxID=1076926 RepID=UPI00103BA69B|nr:glycerophosphodiester phosphodiesterase [Rhizobium laguerreae]TBX99055.1 glycerophosphodiester phosphodiesterase [Rhizobium laguerreae]